MTLKPLIITKEENTVEGNIYRTITRFCTITHGNKSNTLITNLYDNAPEGRDGIKMWHKNMKTLLSVHSGAMQTKAYYLSYFGDKYYPINILDWYRVFLFGFVFNFEFSQGLHSPNFLEIQQFLSSYTWPDSCISF